MVTIYVEGQSLRYSGLCGHRIWMLLEPHVIIWSRKPIHCYVKVQYLESCVLGILQAAMSFNITLCGINRLGSEQFYYPAKNHLIICKNKFYYCPIFIANTTLEMQALPCTSYTHILLSYSITKLIFLLRVFLGN